MQKQFLTLVIALLPTIGCVPNKIKTNVKKGYPENLKRISILMYTKEQAGKSFFEGLKKELEEKFSIHSVNSQFMIEDPVVQNLPNLMIEMVKKYNPDHIIEIRQLPRVGSASSLEYKYATSSQLGGNFDVKIKNMATSEIVWTAQLETTGKTFTSTFYGSETIGDPKKVAKIIVDAINKDLLLD